MAFEEVSRSNSTALPYGDNEFARLVNQYETNEFVHMTRMSNVTLLDITMKLVKQV
jgi:hypothetical protein